MSTQGFNLDALASKVAAKSPNEQWRFFVKKPLAFMVCLFLSYQYMNYSSAVDTSMTLFKDFNKQAPLYPSSKEYKIKSATRFDEGVLFDPVYLVVLDGINKNEPTQMRIIAEHEKDFLTNISKSVTFSYSEVTHSVLNIYPSAVLSEITLKKRQPSFAFLSTFVWIQKDEILISIVVFLSFWIVFSFFSIHLLSSRRKVFMTNFNAEDLREAKPCTVSYSTGDMYFMKRYGRVYPLQGVVYKIDTVDDFVIYNFSKDKKIPGRLLKYKGHSYFFSNRLINQLIKAS